MVQNPGKTLRSDTYKPVNTPEPVQVEEDSSGLPLAVGLPQRNRITAIEDRWRIDDEWWRREPVSRIYYAVLLAPGQRFVFYKDLIDGLWYRQSL